MLKGNTYQGNFQAGGTYQGSGGDLPFFPGGNDEPVGHVRIFEEAQFLVQGSLQNPPQVIQTKKKEKGKNRRQRKKRKKERKREEQRRRTKKETANEKKNEETRKHFKKVLFFVF